MFHVVLFQPEIPPNTGNIIRLCANAGSHLHLIRPIGFELDDARMRRAGLDYREWARMSVHDSLSAFRSAVAPARIYPCSAREGRTYSDARFEPGDALLFGPETRGLPREVLDSVAPARRLRIPMVPGNRSLNLSNAVAVAVFEAWRQQGYAGGA